jgi:hypothetical protein
MHKAVLLDTDMLYDMEFFCDVGYSKTNFAAILCSSSETLPAPTAKKFKGSI